MLFIMINLYLFFTDVFVGSLIKRYDGNDTIRFFLLSFFLSLFVLNKVRKNH